ncbi:fibronectin type III domain-containing protein [Candidatus Pacearchaeota archaeon]|nr:fibronectin type III domain-containing protein [Candidatus Pacearchaeota archaeon]
MKKIFLILCLGIFLVNFSSAVIICIDHEPPSAPTNLILTPSGNSIQLNWDDATDEPACSGIDFYDIYKNNNFLISVEKTNYLDEDLAYGTYEYIIHAWDLAGHNEGVGISKTIILGAENGDNGNGGGGSGGSGGSSSYWQCGEWGECINGNQTRICKDISGNLPDRTETKSCTLSITPLNYKTNEENETQLINQESSSFTSILTGAVTGVGNFAKTGKGAISFIGLIVILTGLIIIRNYRLKKHNLKQNL